MINNCDRVKWIEKWKLNGWKINFSSQPNLNSVGGVYHFLLAYFCCFLERFFDKGVHICIDWNLYWSNILVLTSEFPNRLIYPWRRKTNMRNFRLKVRLWCAEMLVIFSDIYWHSSWTPAVSVWTIGRHLQTTSDV